MKKYRPTNWIRSYEERSTVPTLLCLRCLGSGSRAEASLDKTVTKYSPPGDEIHQQDKTVP
jgi:hypothetical protein